MSQKTLMTFTIRRVMLAIMTIGSLAAVVLAQSDQKPSALRTHSIYMPYIDQDLQNRWFDFGGDTVINTNKYIRLTHDRPSQMGWLWSRLPLTANNFQIEFEFKVDGTGTSVFGDGFAMWITKERAKPGPVFGSVDYFEGLGLFFDTYPNTRHGYSFPYVSAMLGDGKKSYDLPNDGAANELAGCSADFRGKEIATKARLTFYRDNYLMLELQYKAWDEWTQCFMIPNVDLPRVGFLGFSALTGEVSDNHDIVSITTNSLSNTAPHKMPNTGAGAGKRYSSGGTSGLWSFFMFIVKLLVVVAIAFVGLIVFRMYKSSSLGKNNSRF